MNEPERAGDFLIPAQVSCIGRWEVNIRHQLARIQYVTVAGLGGICVDEGLDHLSLVHHFDCLGNQRVFQRKPTKANS